MAENPPFAKQAAKASWVAPLVAIVLGIAARAIIEGNRDMDVETVRSIFVIVGAIAILIAALGLVLGLVALFGISKHGARGILIPSVIGILLSSAYLYLVVSTFLTVRRMANEAAMLSL
jgi:hypothetical protein